MTVARTAGEKSDFSLDNLLFFLYTETGCIGNDLPQYCDLFVASFVENVGHFGLHP